MILGYTLTRLTATSDTFMLQKSEMKKKKKYQNTRTKLGECLWILLEQLYFAISPFKGETV